MRLKFRYSLFTTLGILLHFIALAGIGYWVYRSTSGSYTTAWYITIAICLSLLLLFSLPRMVKVNNSQIVIKCLVECRVIKLRDIKSIHKVSPRAIRPSIPIPMCCAFWSAVGQFYVVKRHKIARLYVTESRYLIEIETINGELYYISCPERDKLLSVVNHVD